MNMKRTKEECVFGLELERIDHGTDDEEGDDWFVLYNIIVTKTGKHIGWLKEEEPGICCLTARKNALRAIYTVLPLPLLTTSNQRNNMAQFIKTTTKKDNSTSYLNINTIDSMRKHRMDDGVYTKIVFIDHTNGEILIVKETLQEIIDQINNPLIT